LPALADPFGLDGHARLLHGLAGHRGLGGDRGGVALRILEQELPGNVHVELSGALHAPLQSLRGRLVLDLLAGRVDSPADRAERLVEIGHRFRRQAAQILLYRTGHVIDDRGLADGPQTRLQAVGLYGKGARNHKNSGNQSGATPATNSFHHAQPFHLQPFLILTPATASAIGSIRAVPRKVHQPPIVSDFSILPPSASGRRQPTDKSLESRRFQPFVSPTWEPSASS
jgi:hypothetical protein